ncbi:twin-arginine translocation signal domain-containing protein [Pseudomonas sp. C27(2019)]|uniref:twin-arginine translocation signal domain-containing protein n=1 Tax=Pseudomonas sp. C27(2019) TaxID=2604941 RepID=UPI001244C514|nr:twin-arginine translocation signal domain-containing protein [Pseudomonas sp. C27(2019)]QEY57698.1 twin-arginine translocation signal domain-containing protein [Pseudomonas sp. C27(2019)]
MPHTVQSAEYSRRSFLKLSAASAATLSVLSLSASLTGCSSEPASSGFLVLRGDDLECLSALLPVLYSGAISTEQMSSHLHSTLRAIDDNLASFSPAMRKLTLQLFDVLNNPLTRGPLTGVWGAWPNASTADIQHFLKRWENSRFDLLKMGHNALLQLAMLAHYGQPSAWQHCGYPGPPVLQ